MRKTHLLRIAVTLSLFLIYAMQADADESIQHPRQLPKEITEPVLSLKSLGDILEPTSGFQREDWFSFTGTDFYRRSLRLEFQTTETKQHFVERFESGRHTAEIEFDTDVPSAKAVLFIFSTSKIVACLEKGKKSSLSLGDPYNRTQSYYLAVWSEDNTAGQEMAVEITVESRKRPFVQIQKLQRLHLKQTVDVKLKTGDINKLFTVFFPQRGRFEITFPGIDADELPFRAELNSVDRKIQEQGLSMSIPRPGTYVLKIDTIDPIDPSKPTTLKPFQIETTFEGQAWQVRAVEPLEGPPY